MNTNTNTTNAPADNATTYAVDLLRAEGGPFKYAPRGEDFAANDVWTVRTVVKQFVQTVCRFDGAAFAAEDKPLGFETMRITFYGRPAYVKFARRGNEILVAFEGIGGRVIVDACRYDLAAQVVAATRRVVGLRGVRAAQ